MIGLALVAVLAVMTPACGDDDGPSAEGVAIAATSPQDVSEGTVEVDEVTLAEPGYVCVFGYDESVEGEDAYTVLGASELMLAGTERDVVVRLSGRPTTSALTVSPCTDDGDHAYGNVADHPVEDDDGRIEAVVEIG